MILHQQTPSPADGFFSVHCESLTLAWCRPAGSRVIVTPLPAPTGTAAVEILHPVSPDQAARLIAADIANHGPSRHSAAASTRPDPPEYLLVNSLDGTTPGIMRTVDPLFIVLADPDTGILGTPSRVRSSADLSAEGWAYWWEDARRAFESLTVDFCHAVGTPPPPAFIAAP